MATDWLLSLLCINTEEAGRQEDKYQHIGGSSAPAMPRI